LIESELFGHEKGAFTGATEQRIGVFERSRGGTIFLDEIGELPLALQTRLLRVLDRRTIRRVGGNIQHAVDVRLVAATNRDLTEAVKQGGFRQDLYYRLSVVKVVVPPLRKRREDIPLLARHFLRQIGNVADAETVLTPELLEVLASRRWPGNVRELRNVIERATIMIDGAAAPFESSDPGDPGAAPAPPSPPAVAEEASGPSAWLERAVPDDFWGQSFKAARDRLVGEFERQYLWRLVQRYGSNISAIARDAGIDRHQVRRMLRRHGMYEG
jgi:DNA-binding NtrC family response regulator